MSHYILCFYYYYFHFSKKKKKKGLFVEGIAEGSEALLIIYTNILQLI